LIYRRLQLLGFRVPFGAGPRFALQLGQTLLGGADAWLELVPLQVSFLVGIDQASDTTTHSREQTR